MTHCNSSSSAFPIECKVPVSRRFASSASFSTILMPVLPLRSSPRNDSLAYPLRSWHKTRMVPHRNIKFCDPSTFSPTDRGFDSRFGFCGHPLQILRYSHPGRFRRQEDGWRDSWSKDKKKGGREWDYGSGHPCHAPPTLCRPATYLLFIYFIQYSQM